MVTKFTQISALTVPHSYSWDYGCPQNDLPIFCCDGTSRVSRISPPVFSPYTPIPAYTTATYISGYAPYLWVLFSNKSVPNPPTGTGTTSYFQWDFGDYYNDDTNIVNVPCVEHCVEHIYVMPGIYSVTLTQFELKRNQKIDEYNNPCIGKYDKLWYWDKMLCSAPNITNRVTWDDTACSLKGKYSRTWDSEIQCLQRHCINWSWTDLSGKGHNPVKWSKTLYDQEFDKKWMYEPPVGDCTITDVTSTVIEEIIQQTVVKTYLIEVKEIMPTARLCVVTNPSHGVAPLTVRVSPNKCTPGSFPFEKIVWDAGDNTPQVTVSRRSTPDTSQFVYNNSFPSDPKDPRNYDRIHTYNRDTNNWHTFFPSITAYCSNTNNHDDCSVIVGPVEPPDAKMHLLKARNFGDSILYAVQAGNTEPSFTSYPSNTPSAYSIGFLLSNEELNSHPIAYSTALVPSSPLRPSCLFPWPYTGNPGTGYPYIHTAFYCCVPPTPTPTCFVTVSTFAGTGTFGGADGPALNATFKNPECAVFDSAGNMFITDWSGNKIRKVSPGGIVSTFAGTGATGSLDGVGSIATFNNPEVAVFDSSGNLFVCESANRKIRKITPAGVVTTFAGTGAPGNTNGPALAATFGTIRAIAFDSAGNLYTVDSVNDNIRKITPGGIVTTFIGAPSVALSNTEGIVFDSADNMYISDASANKILKITPGGVVTTYAGSGAVGSLDGSALTATFNYPQALVFDIIGNLYVVETGNNKIRKITPGGIVSTIAGTGSLGSLDGPANTATFNQPTGVTIGSDGNLYVGDYGNNKIRKITLC